MINVSNTEIKSRSRLAENSFCEIDSIVEGLAITDLKGNIVRCNDVFIRIFNLGKLVDTRGSNISDLFGGSHIKNLRAHLGEDKTDNKARYELELSDRSGGRKFVNALVAPRYANGRIAGYICSAVDTTEYHQTKVQTQNDLDKMTSLMIELLQKEAENRRRIAARLHGCFSQNLAAANLKIEELSGYHVPDEYAAKLTEIRNLFDEIIKESRSVIFEISPLILYDLGLEHAMGWLIEKLKDKFHVNIEFQNDRLSDSIDIRTKVILFDAVREILLNAIRHSGGTRIRVNIKRIKWNLITSIDDNGKGFEPLIAMENAEKSGFTGLPKVDMIMRSLGGALKIRSKRENGCLAILEIPLERAKENSGK